MTKGLTRLRSVALALALVAGAVTSAEAAPMLKYQTATAIDLSTGITGPNLISFTPASQEVDLRSGVTNATLGAFVVAAPASGSKTVYDNVPFAITFVPQSLDGSEVSAVSQVITGVLNGVVDGAHSTDLEATFNQPTGSIDLGSQIITLSFPETTKLLVPSDGLSTVQAKITSIGGDAPVPEPSTIALVLTTIGGLALRQRVAGRRARLSA